MKVSGDNNVPPSNVELTSVSKKEPEKKPENERTEGIVQKFLKEMSDSFKRMGNPSSKIKATFENIITSIALFFKNVFSPIPPLKVSKDNNVPLINKDFVDSYRKDPDVIGKRDEQVLKVGSEKIKDSPQVAYQYGKDASRSFLVRDGKTAANPNEQDLTLKERDIMTFNDGLKKDYGSKGLFNLSKIMSQGLLGDLTNHLTFGVYPPPKYAVSSPNEPGESKVKIEVKEDEQGNVRVITSMNMRVTEFVKGEDDKVQYVKITREVVIKKADIDSDEDPPIQTVNDKLEYHQRGQV